MSTSERYNRWQGLAIGQLSVAIALFSALSIAGLGTGLSLLQSTEFLAALQCKRLFATSLVLFALCALCSSAAVVSRTLDFRLTARVTRKRHNADYNRRLTIFCLEAKAYGKLTWFFFWVAFLTLSAAGVSFGVALGSAYVPVLFPKIAA
jgi:hypothetical protein